jgi:hypothetical protein
VRGPPSGEPVAAVVARGEAEIGFQQVSELIHVPGVTVVGPLPAELQPGFSFAGALTSAVRQPEAASALIRFLASPEAAPAILAAGLTPAGEQLPKGVMLLKPDQIVWHKTPTGRELAYLHGHPDKPGPYLYLVKWPPHNKALAHTHPDERYGMVLSGTHYIGYGERFDEKKLHAHPAGSYFTEPANTAHFGMTKSEGAVLYFYGIGPSGSKALEKEGADK